MRIYLAAGYTAHPHMREIRDRLAEFGHTVTSRWIAGDHAATSPADGEAFALDDMDDIDAAVCLVCFTHWPSTTGGRHVELGYALGLGHLVILVGPVENIFQTCADLTYPDVAAFLAAVESGAVPA